MRSLTLSILLGFVLSLFTSATPTLAVSYVCPSGINATNSIVLDSTCYAYYASAKSWSQAETACQGVGGHLVAIRTAIIDEAIASIAPAEVWIGASDNGSNISGASEGNFFWAGDTTSFWEGGEAGAATNGRYTNWNTDEPNDFGSNEDCVVKYDTGKWNDYVCGNGRNYVCGIPAEDPTSSSSSTAGTARSGGLRSQSLQMRIDQAVKKLKGKRSTAPASGKTKGRP